MDELAVHKEAHNVLTEIPRHAEVRSIPSSPAKGTPVPLVNLILLALTLLTTTMAGAYTAGSDFSLLRPIASLGALASGLSFSLPLMTILLAHEMGHYLVARRNQVDTTLPYFLPAPLPSLFIFGTFGAFIRMRSMPPSRRVMFDIGAAGPWAGMLIAGPCVVIGISMSDIGPLGQGAGGLELGNSLLFWGLLRWILGVDPALVTVNLHPLALAGWIGFLVTTLNLLPVGQLDGGHVIYALFPRFHRTISTLFVALCITMVVVPLAVGWSFWPGWLLWAVLAVALGLGHPATYDRDTPLDLSRRIAASLTVLLFILTFVPVPFSLSAPDNTPPSRDSQTYQVQHRSMPERLPPVIRI